ncbi:MAG: sodium:solute symporter [Candidatus Eremiobacteraeota bacterium]|nr:sodium:solute symporter [Candidatus Eremiobacteraeota bacterium]
MVAGVTAIGFLAARWRQANLANLEQWALGGRGFGTIVSWFLIGGDCYTAYTFIAVPALVYGVGALGFFAVPVSTLVYPIVFVVLARFYGVARRRGYVTMADFVRDRFGDRTLEIAIALTGVVALMPYVALQLVGMKAVFLQLGGAFETAGGLPALTVAFVLLAGYTYTSGLRGPAMIAFVKDTLIYVTVIAAVVIIPARLGGWQHVFASTARAFSARSHPASIVLTPQQCFTFATRALGSALALFLYPNLITGVLAASSRNVVRRNAALLPAYGLLLGLLALLGYCAVAAGIATTDTSSVMPRLFGRFFPGWFAGVGDAAVVVGALVPASIMCISAANLFASNVCCEFTPKRTPLETKIAKAFTLGMCIFGLLAIFFMPVAYAIDFQLLGGCLILQTLPAFVVGLWSRWFYARALLLGWACGVAASCAMAYVSHFSPDYTLTLFGTKLTGFIALYGLAINFGVAAAATLALRALRTKYGLDSTVAADYA